MLISGNIMTLSYNIGLTAGSLVAYLLDAILGPSHPNTCKPGGPPLMRPTADTKISQVVSTVTMVTPLLTNLSSVVPTEAGSSIAPKQLVGPLNATVAAVTTTTLATPSTAVTATVLATTVLGIAVHTFSPEQFTPAPATIFNGTSSSGLVTFNTTFTK